MGIQFDDLSTPDGLKSLDRYLATRNYISGHQATRDDLAVFVNIKSVPLECQNLSRWFNHIAQLLGPKFSDPGVGVHIASGPVPATPAKPPAADETPEAEAARPPAAETPASEAETAPPAKADDLDFFGEETEEEKAALEKREAEKKASDKPKVVQKSSIVLDIKPWDDETDMRKLEECVRAIQMPGLHWGASKLEEVVPGIKKLEIVLTIQDDLVSIDNLIEDYLTSEPNNKYIQSCDIVAFNKICK